MADYKVVWGDTLGALARKWDTTVQAIMDANPIIKDKDQIRVGWELTIPGSKPTESSTTAKPPPDPTKKKFGGRELNNIPGRPEVWKVGKTSYLVYIVPGTENDPVYMSWEVTGKEDLEAFYGPDQPIVYDREMSQGQYNSMTPLEFGSTDEIPASEKDPFATWESEIERQAISQPWILDEDYQALMAMSILEGRPLTAAEIKTTDWWRTHNEAQRTWMAVFHGDPKQAQVLIADNEDAVKAKLTASGAGQSPPERVVSYIATQWAKGNWTESYVNTQIKAITDPSYDADIDSGLLPIIDKHPITQTVSEEDTVRSLVNQWLGPTFGSWDQATVEEWAGKLRNDPEQEQRLVEALKDQRMAVLPEYDNRELSYQAIANTWKQFWIGQWGQNPDEKNDPAWTKVLKMNDTDEAARFLRKEGYNRGIGKVTADLNSQTARTLGGSTRNPIYA